MKISTQERVELILRLRAAKETTIDDDLAVWNVISTDETPWYFHDRVQETITTNRYGVGAVGNPICSLDRSTIDCNAAISFAQSMGNLDVIHTAWSSVSRDHALHVRFWEPSVDGDYAVAFAKEIVLALLEHPFVKETPRIDMATRGIGGMLSADAIIHQINSNDFDRLVEQCENAPKASPALKAFLAAGRELLARDA